jgi:hypothetical protein
LPDTAQPDPLPNTDLYLRRTTTTKPTTTKHGGRGENEKGSVEFARWVPGELKESAKTMVGHLPAVLAQMVIDEWANALDAGSIRRSPLG